MLDTKLIDSFDRGFARLEDAKSYWLREGDTEMVAVAKSDLAHVKCILSTYKQTGSIRSLNKFMWCLDTIVRETFIEVYDYLEEIGYD